MGCGKSKYDVASGNTTILQQQKPCVSVKENETETKHTNNNNINNVSYEENKIVKENGYE